MGTAGLESEGFDTDKCRRTAWRPPVSDGEGRDAM